MRKRDISAGLSALACLGVGVTAFLSAKRTGKYKYIRYEIASKKWNDMDEDEFYERKDDTFYSVLTKKDKAIIFGKSHWPTLVSGFLTCGCIVGAQILDIEELVALGGVAAAATCKYNDAMNYIREKYPDEYAEVKRYVDGEAAKRAIKKKPEYKEETYDGRKRYYFPKSDQVVFMKPEDLIAVQGFISSTFGTRLEVHINEILDFIHQDLGYKDVHLCDTDYIWEFTEDDETLSVETYNFPNIELEYDDILDDDGESIVCQVVTLSIEPRVYK